MPPVYASSGLQHEPIGNELANYYDIRLQLGLSEIKNVERKMPLSLNCVFDHKCKEALNKKCVFNHKCKEALNKK